MGQYIDDGAARLAKHEATDSPLLVAEGVGDLEALLHGPGVDGIDVGHLYRNSIEAGIATAGTQPEGDDGRRTSSKSFGLDVADRVHV